MSEPQDARVDLNLLIGPWPTDAQPEWRVADVQRYLDRFDVAFGLVRHSVAVDYDAAEGNQRLLDEIAGTPRLVPAFVLGPLDAGQHGSPQTLPARMKAVGVRAVWLYPQRHDWSVCGPEAALLLATLRRCGLPVFIDLAETDWGGVAGLATVLPELDIVVTGIGYRTLGQALPVLDQHRLVHVDLSYTAALDGLELLVERYGAGRILLGTGAPVRDPAAPWFLLEHSDLEPQDRAVVGGTAARSLLGLLERDVPARLRGADDKPSRPIDIIDAHAHVGCWPSSWVPHPDAPALLRALQRTGTRHAVISHMAALWVDTPGGNEAAIAVAQRHPAELSVYLVANPNRPQDREILDRQLTSAQVSGIKVHPDTHDCPLDDSRYEWVWRLAERHGIPVLSHGFAGTGHSDPYLFGAVADRHPDLTLLVGHSGATVEGFRRTIDVAGKHPNLLAETCGSWMTGDWLFRLVDALGADRVIHGTDACLIDPRYGVGRVLGAGLQPDQQALVLGGNARRVLRLPPLAARPLGGQ